MKTSEASRGEINYSKWRSLISNFGLSGTKAWNRHNSILKSVFWEGRVGEEVLSGATVFSLERLIPWLSSFGLWSWTWTGLRWGHEGLGKWEKLGVAASPLHGTGLLTLGLWKSCICRYSPDPGPVLPKASWNDSVFWNNRGRRRINPWQTSGQEMWNTCLPGVPSNVSNQWTRLHLNLLWLLWNL